MSGRLDGTDEALREAAERYRSVVAAMSEGVVFFDDRGRILDCNPSAERLLGVDRDAILGRTSSDPIWRVIRDDGSPFPADEYPANRTLRDGSPVRGTLMGVCVPDGAVRWLMMNSEPLLRPGEARPYAVVTSFSDVTDVRAAREAVRIRETRLRVALECARHAFWEVALPGTALVAGAPWTLVGYREGEFPRTMESWRALIHPDHRRAARAAFEAHVAGLTPWLRSEYQVRARDGGWRWIVASGRVYERDASGRPTCAAGTMTDVTELKGLQTQLQAADRLASVGTLAAGVAHEMNNPLAYVVSNLGFVNDALAQLERGTPGAPAPGELRQALRDALDGAGRVRAIVRGLRQFAVPERAAAHEPVDVATEIEAALGLARNELVHRARVSVDVPASLPRVIAGEHDLGQVLVNLLLNAAQAIPEGRAAENEVRIAAGIDGDWVVVEVRDTGAGIAPADLPRIFDPFFTTKPVGCGTGLGLSVCHGIVTGLGGRIHVESLPGQGARFRVSLPIAPEPEREAGPATPVPPAAPRRGRVLVLDDEPLVGRSLVRLLQSSHDVEALVSPAEALRRIAGGERWDVILCDLMMPELSGMDLEDRIAEVAPALVPCVIYLTGGAFTDRSRAFLAAGRPYLEKPVEPAELRARVDERIRAARQ
ncbi:ATP-binding protein [Anaeromyxobacter oryzae]|uniref:histidine kinase n=1 Tax=Anaeromyxobacter oryzae TaxID=2918170 RepID=A0ABN6MR83_9BACT|nr:ATP-binding protein [Anaeromyxobacter oryzae]BDG01903.1 hypothetical protein AMOR_08990 [Anaeromyxobacter oryzae]